MFKRSGRGPLKSFCINEECPAFVPEEKRRYPKKKTDEIPADEEKTGSETEEKTAKTASAKAGKTTAKKTTKTASAKASGTKAGKTAAARTSKTAKPAKTAKTAAKKTKE